MDNKGRVMALRNKGWVLVQPQDPIGRRSSRTWSSYCHRRLKLTYWGSTIEVSKWMIEWVTESPSRVRVKDPHRLARALSRVKLLVSDRGNAYQSRGSQPHLQRWKEATNKAISSSSRSSTKGTTHWRFKGLSRRILAIFKQELMACSTTRSRDTATPIRGLATNRSISTKATTRWTGATSRSPLLSEGLNEHPVAISNGWAVSVTHHTRCVKMVSGVSPDNLAVCNNNPYNNKTLPLSNHIFKMKPFIISLTRLLMARVTTTTTITRLNSCSTLSRTAKVPPDIFTLTIAYSHLITPF